MQSKYCEQRCDTNGVQHQGHNSKESAISGRNYIVSFNVQRHYIPKHAFPKQIELLYIKNKMYNLPSPKKQK